MPTNIAVIKSRLICQEDLAIGSGTVTEYVLGQGLVALTKIAALPTAVERADILGTRDGSNDTFTLNTTHSATIVLELILWNGIVMEPGIGYVRSGVTVTMQTGFIPTGSANETFESIILYS